MNLFQDALISYGRADSKGFAIHLRQRLQDISKTTGLANNPAEKFKIWLDLDDIPFGVDYQKQIDDSIDKADNILFIISPHSLHSKYCALEINLALERHKRIIPLMHVEEISRETWQQRHPHGTDEEWETYKAEGRHSSYKRLDAEQLDPEKEEDQLFVRAFSAIKKINWIWFREGVDDDEASLQALIETLNRDRDYVHRHTVLLNRALQWERNNRRSRDLLVEDTLQAAENWLQKQFEDRQPPCLPTPLHCEFISESLKNAQGGFTDVFLIHAEEDKAIQEEIYALLTRVGLTVWSSWQDIQKGVPFKDAIERGIETADTMLYLISPDSVQSAYCRDEIYRAKSFHKRIIPILVKPMDFQQFPAEIQGLQFVDLTRDLEGSRYRKNRQDLLNALTHNEDAKYYKAHKLLLTKALKWDRQYRNDTILLRGYALQQAEAWLQLAQKRELHRPLPIQIEYVEESQRQPPNAELNAFITSDAKDLEFARKLTEQLQIQGERTWFRPDETAPGPDYLKQVYEAIEHAQNCIFILSRDAITDETLQEELQIAESLSKRIITVTYRALKWSQVPETLFKSPRVDFQAYGEDFMTSFGVLYRILKSNQNHVRDHTRLLIKALEWQHSEYSVEPKKNSSLKPTEARSRRTPFRRIAPWVKLPRLRQQKPEPYLQRDTSTLLRRKELEKAQKWLEQAKTQTPKPSNLHIDYINASQQLLTKKVKPTTVLSLSIGAAAVVLIIRAAGLLQGAELLAYDFLLTRRPSEQADDRFLIVEVDGKSNSYLRGKYEAGYGTIPDEALALTLDRLNRYQSGVIGLDFYRDFAANEAIVDGIPGEKNLADVLRETEQLITVCKMVYDGEGTKPPPEVPLSRIGFSDIVNEKNRPFYVRRHLLEQSPLPDEEFCTIRTAFSLRVAERYLRQVQPQENNAQGVSNRQLSPASDSVYISSLTAEGEVGESPLQFVDGPTVPKLDFNLGPYSLFGVRYDFFGGYQTLLNIRAVSSNRRRKDPLAFAPTISLEDLLEEELPEPLKAKYSGFEDLIKNRIVLIGYTDSADRNVDIWNTPYGRMPGVSLQGQMTSQLISAVQDDPRPLIRWWPFGIVILWILGWAIAIGFVVQRLTRPAPAIYSLMGGTLVLVGSGYLAMVLGSFWIPLIPPLLAMVLAGGGVIWLGQRLRNP